MLEHLSHPYNSLIFKPTLSSHTPYLSSANSSLSSDTPFPSSANPPLSPDAPIPPSATQLYPWTLHTTMSFTDFDITNTNLDTSTNPPLTYEST